MSLPSPNSSLSSLPDAISSQSLQVLAYLFARSPTPLFDTIFIRSEVAPSRSVAYPQIVFFFLLLTFLSLLSLSRVFSLVSLPSISLNPARSRIPQLLATLLPAPRYQLITQ